MDVLRSCESWRNRESDSIRNRKPWLRLARAGSQISHWRASAEQPVAGTPDTVGSEGSSFRRIFVRMDLAVTFREKLCGAPLMVHLYNMVKCSSLSPEYEYVLKLGYLQKSVCRWSGRRKVHCGSSPREHNCGPVPVSLSGVRSRGLLTNATAQAYHPSTALTRALLEHEKLVLSLATLVEVAEWEVGSHASHEVTRWWWW